MSFLMKLLGSTGTGGIWVYLAIGLAVYGAGAASGFWVRVKLDAPTIAGLQTEVAVAKGATDRAEKALAEQRAATAIDVARSNDLALTQQRALTATIEDLGAKLAQAQKGRREASLKLLDTLKAIPHDQQISLSPPVRQYLRAVQEAQKLDKETTRGLSDPGP